MSSYYNRRKRRSSYDNFYPPYVTVAEKRQRAMQKAKQLAKKGEVLNPVVLDGTAIARTFWGKAWCTNVETYQDYANRLPRGRSYVRANAVIDLKLLPGKITAMVMGTSLYNITLTIKPLAPGRWNALKQKCVGKIASLLELIRGNLPKEILQEFCDPKSGLFPAMDEIQFSCSCPDYAHMCKHCAAVLYAVGHRLDEEPSLFFTLRGLDPNELLGATAVDVLAGDGGTEDSGLGTDVDIEDVFGVKLDSLDDTASAATSPATPEKNKAPRNVPAKQKGKALGTTQKGKALGTTQKGKALGTLSSQKAFDDKDMANKRSPHLNWNGPLLRAWRAEHGLTQQALARRLGCTNVTISLLENGKKKFDKAFCLALDML